MQERNIPKSTAPWERSANCLRPRFGVSRGWNFLEWQSSAITLVYFNLECAVLSTCLWEPILVFSHPLDILISIFCRSLQVSTPRPKPGSPSPRPASPPSLCASTNDTFTVTHSGPLPAALPSPLSRYVAAKPLRPLSPSFLLHWLPQHFIPCVSAVIVPP